MKKVFAIGAVLLTACAARADVSLPHIFSDHMVLQRSKPLPVWGTAAPAEKVTVSLDGKSKTATADAEGKWRLDLPAMAAGGPYTLEVKGNNTVTLSDVFVGEVWIASGQSNMEFPLKRANNAEGEIAAANFPDIREYKANMVVAAQPQSDGPGKWKVCAPETAGDFSAVAFLFAREIHQKLKVPIGIVNITQGWTPGEAWMSREALQSDADLDRDILQKWDAYTAPEVRQKYDEEMKAWQAQSEKNKAAGVADPPQPKAPKDPNFFHRATGLWNGMVAPVVPFAARGVIWYQGETNDQRGYQYRKLFPALITDWRKKWGQPALPFAWVQLASVLPPDPEPVESEWSEVREAQAMTLRLPETGQAVTIDIGDDKDVHPKNKQDVGHRLALWARAKVYGEKIDYSGPVYKQMKVEGQAIRLTFDHTDKGLATRDGKELRGFDIAGADHKFYHAVAKIDKNTVVVSCDKVAEPQSVRYAWANNALDANFCAQTAEGELLPAGPFRTDDWPGKSFGVIKMPVDDM